MPPLEPYSPLSGRDQASTQAQDALGGFPTDGEYKSGVTASSLDSLSEYTLPGKEISGAESTCMSVAVLSSVGE